jgi:hypothetical protein
MGREGMVDEVLRGAAVLNIASVRREFCPMPLGKCSKGDRFLFGELANLLGNRECRAGSACD